MKVLCLLIGLTLAASAQDVLNNDSVVKMVKAGLSDTIVISTIQNSAGSYTTNADALIKLKQSGVSDGVIAAMVTKGSGGAAPALAAKPAEAAAPSDADIPQNVDIGVYYKKDGKWEEMLPEVVNWKTGGVIKHMASAGVVKGDVNGHVEGQHSRNSAKSPVEVVVYAPEGTAITEYQLIHLHENGNSREFRTVTGGVLHESGGATRDVIPFEGKRVASRMYKVLLPTTIGAGDFGFLPPGAIGASNSASIGKLYSFRIIE